MSAEYAYLYRGSYEPYQGMTVFEDEAEDFVRTECGLMMLDEDAPMYRDFMDSTMEWFFGSWDKKPVERFFEEEPENPFDFT